MTKIFYKFVKVCSKTGRIQGFKRQEGIYKLLIPFIGLLSIVWIIIRVIPKPDRMNYPCMRVAMPIASGFIGQILSIIIAASLFIKKRSPLFQSPVFFTCIFCLLGLGTSYWLIKSNEKNDNLLFPDNILIANAPLGVAKGIFPGRVVWVHNSNAVNQACVPDSFEHAWFTSENNNQNVIDSMVSKAIRSLTGEKNDVSAWQAIFKYHNLNYGKGSIGYKKGEKIFIKTNATSSYANLDTTNLTPVINPAYGTSETSPAIVLSILRQLVYNAGVSQQDIYVGDPLRHIYKHCYDLWHPEFPNVHYLDHDSVYKRLGREQALPSTTAKIYFSDKGKVLRLYGVTGDPVYSDYIYQIFEDAEYVLNIPMLKGHRSAGVTMFAKNNFGSQTRIDASHLHNGLVFPPPWDSARFGYGLYRVQVDFMGNKYFGKKNLFYLMDALWPADQDAGVPKRWKMQPFNNEFMASVFASFDPVAIECVGYDFLKNEFTTERASIDGTYTCVQMTGSDDYLRQAADSTTWPAGVKYDPDNTGVSMSSLGAYEHWNNSLDKQYSRNLGTGNGIELLATSAIVSVQKNKYETPKDFFLYPNYPNPFNPSTRIKFSLKNACKVNLSIYDINGRLVDIIMKNELKPAGTYYLEYNAVRLSSGIYFLSIHADNYIKVQKIIYLK